jgi:hypothetical protein
VREVISGYPRLDKPLLLPNRDIICAKNVKAKLLIGLQEKLPWVTIGKLDDAAVDMVSRLLLEEIDSAIKSHPTVGKTFKV